MRYGRTLLSGVVAMMLFVVVRFSSCDQCNPLTFVCSSRVPTSENICETVIIAQHKEFETCKNEFIAKYPELLAGSGEHELDASQKLFRHRPVGDVFYTGLNISVGVNPGTKAVLLHVSLPTSKINLCKAMLLNDTVRSQKRINSWACTFFEATNVGEEFVANVKIYPQLDEWNSLSKAGSVKNFEPNWADKWMAPVYLVTTDAVRGSLKACFQQAPRRLGTFNYTLTLESNGAATADSAVAGSENDSEILCRTYGNLEPGTYAAAVRLSPCDPAGAKCKRSRSPPIRIASPAEPGFKWIYILAVGIFCVILIVVVTYCMVGRLGLTYSQAMPANAVVHYSHDNEIHSNTVYSLYNLLRANHVNVDIDKHHLIEDPIEWLNQQLLREDVVTILVMSRGAIYKASQPGTEGVRFEGEPGYLTGHLFRYIVRLVTHRVVLRHEIPWNPALFVTVVWDESKRAQVRRLLPDFKVYVLPREWHQFIEHVRYVRDWKQLRFSSLRACCLTRAKGSRSLGKHEVGRRFLDQCRRMVDEGDHHGPVAGPSDAPGSSTPEEQRQNESDQQPESGYYSREPGIETVELSDRVVRLAVDGNSCANPTESGENADTCSFCMSGESDSSDDDDAPILKAFPKLPPRC